jgi:hypothetical protein
MLASMDRQAPIFIKAANHTSSSFPAVAGPKIIKDVLVHEKMD